MKTFKEYLTLKNESNWQHGTGPGEFDINKYLVSTGRIVKGLFHRIICKDKFSMSVQAGKIWHCEPKTDHGPWTELEVGSISSAESLLKNYKESPLDDDHGPGIVFPYVPAEVINDIVEKHGGLSWKDMGMTPPFDIFKRDDPKAREERLANAKKRALGLD